MKKFTLPVPPDNIKALRRRAGLTQGELAERLGNLTKQHVCSVETGYRRLSAKRAWGWHVALDCSLAELYAGTPLESVLSRRPPTEAEWSAPVPHESIRLARLFTGLCAVEAAERLNVTVWEYARFEDGRTPLRVWQLVPFAEAFDMPVTAFLKGTAFEIAVDKF